MLVPVGLTDNGLIAQTAFVWYETLLNIAIVNFLLFRYAENLVLIVTLFQSRKNSIQYFILNK